MPFTTTRRCSAVKELETLERVTGEIAKLTVCGGLDGVLKDVAPMGV